MYRLTGRIETGKFANLLLICAAFSMALAAFAGSRKKLSAWPVAMAVLVAANPVALCQILHFLCRWANGLALCLPGSPLFPERGRRQSVGEPVLLFEAAVLIIQVKFTGLVYVTILFAGFLAVAGVAETSLAKALLHGGPGLGARDVRLRNESLCVQYPRERPPVLSFFRKRRFSEFQRDE